MAGDRGAFALLLLLLFVLCSHAGGCLVWGGRGESGVPTPRGSWEAHNPPMMEQPPPPAPCSPGTRGEQTGVVFGVPCPIHPWPGSPVSGCLCFGGGWCWGSPGWEATAPPPRPLPSPVPPPAVLGQGGGGPTELCPLLPLWGADPGQGGTWGGGLQALGGGGLGCPAGTLPSSGTGGCGDTREEEQRGFGDPGLGRGGAQKGGGGGGGVPAAGTSAWATPGDVGSSASCSPCPAPRGGPRLGGHHPSTCARGAVTPPPAAPQQPPGPRGAPVAGVGVGCLGKTLRCHSFFWGHTHVTLESTWLRGGPGRGWEGDWGWGGQPGGEKGWIGVGGCPRVGLPRGAGPLLAGKPGWGFTRVGGVSHSRGVPRIGGGGSQGRRVPIGGVSLGSGGPYGGGSLGFGASKRVVVKVG